MRRFVDKGLMSYHVYLIPENNSKIRKFRLRPRSILGMSGLAVAVALLLVLAAVGFLHYRSLYASLEKEHETIRAYEKERVDLLGKVAMLESTVGETEKMAGKLAALVGSERVSIEKGIGPIPSAPSAFEPEKLDSLEDRVVTLQDKIKELTKIQEDKLTYIASTPSVWPVKGWVTSDFGYRRSPFTLAADFHEGIDIAAARGTPVSAPADGVVTFAGYKGGYGKMVVIDHGFGIVTKYGHTSEFFVKEGDRIKRGTKIALVGSTGHSTGPHLHYEIYSDGVPVDPMKYILK
ncbi:MAG TPA: peptidoglycan DD-metalloendopeptidase family protein [bacterium]|nr:peptidoglycan DD-metalloendopeptidase family protein [bacterium]